MSRSLLTAAALLLWTALAPPTAQADATLRFNRVTVVCSDDLHCAATLRAGNEPEAAILTLARSPESRARWTVSLTTPGSLADRDRPVALSVDNGVDITLQPLSDYAPFVRAQDYYIVSQSALDRLMLQIQRGHMLRFSYIDIAGAPHADLFPLDGLPQALSAIDDRQKRIGGDRRAAAPRDLPPAPEVDEAELIAGEGLPPPLVERHMASGDCEAPDGPSIKDVAPVIGPLSDTATLYAVPCFRAAAGAAFRLYVVERGEIGGVDQLHFAGWSPRFGWTGTDTLYDVAFDPATARLTASELDITGCRLSGSWRWDEFALSTERLTVGTGCGDTPAGTELAAHP